MHEEDFLRSWLRDDTEGKAEEVKDRERKDQEKRLRVGRERWKNEAKGSKLMVDECGLVCRLALSPPLTFSFPLRRKVSRLLLFKRVGMM